MESFQFNDKIINLVIQEKEYQLNLSEKDVLKEIISLEFFLKKKVDKLKSTKDIETVYEHCIETIDTLLGDGACSAIFKGRTINIFDLTSLLQYITSAVHTQQMQDDEE